MKAGSVGASEAEPRLRIEPVEVHVIEAACLRVLIRAPQSVAAEQTELVIIAGAADQARLARRVSHNWFFEGQFAAAKTEVARNLDQRGVDRDKITLVEGFFNDSLTPELKQQHPFKPVSVAMIDVDLYSSTCEVLSWLQDFLVSGSIVIFDDWFAYGDGDELGQPRAFQDFLEGNPHLTSEPLLEYEPNGKVFILRAA